PRTSAARRRGRSISAWRTGACRCSTVGNSRSCRTMRILIVDDSAMMRAMIKRVVGLSAIAVEEILEAGNGVEALAVLESNDIQVMFTDINMPVMNGTELL